MARESRLGQRLAAVEHAIAEIRRRLAGGPAPSNGIDKLIGSITDEAAFRAALQFGRAFRQADRPADEPTKGP